MRCSIWLLLAAGLAIMAVSMTAQEPLSVTRHEFKHQGITVIETRTLDSSTGLINRVARTLDGVVVDVDALSHRESRLQIARDQKMSPDLAERVVQADPVNRPLGVAFWLRFPDTPDFRCVLEAAMEKGMTPENARCVARDTAENFYLPRTRLFALGLVARGYEVLYTGTISPSVIARIPAEDIAAVAADARVSLAYHGSEDFQTLNEYAQPTHRTPTAHSRGITGKGSTLKVMVNDPEHVTKGNPYLPTVTWVNTLSIIHQHATACAGNICSQHSKYYGVVKALPQIYSGAGAGDAGAPPVWDAAIKKGISYGNCSWWNLKRGKIEYLDRYFDHIIRNFGVMMFAACGNLGETSAPMCTTPSNAYNVISSGCYNDGDTRDWKNDKMASYSSYQDPKEGHDKPEVVSPGDKVSTLQEKSPWVFGGFDGTSSASPLTLGVAALAGTRDTLLRTHTHTLKAILMTTAWHNLEGDAVLSDKDGAGGLHAGAADAVVRDKQYIDGTLTTASFSGGKKDVQIQIQAGTRTRVMAIWLSNADSKYATDTLDMDLDMAILDPNNKVVASSASTKNPYEILSFYPRVTGTYTVRLTRQRFNGTSEPYAVVWSNRHDMATAQVTLNGTGQIGTTMKITFTDKYHPAGVYVAAASFSTLPQYLALPEGHLIPLGIDNLFLATASGAFPGFKGTLNGQGTGQASMPLPNLTIIRGIKVYLAVAVFRSGSGGKMVKGTSEAVSFTIM